MAVQTKTELATAITALFANNTTGDIEADEVLAVFTDVIDSLAFLTDATDVTFGSGVPDDANGKNKDAYLDVDAGTWYTKSSGSWSDQFTFELTNDQLHALSQIAGLEDKTADLAIEDSYTWSDTDRRRHSDPVGRAAYAVVDGCAVGPDADLQFAGRQRRERLPGAADRP